MLMLSSVAWLLKGNDMRIIKTILFCATVSLACQSFSGAITFTRDIFKPADSLSHCSLIALNTQQLSQLKMVGSVIINHKITALLQCGQCVFSISQQQYVSDLKLTIDTIKKNSVHIRYQTASKQPINKTLWLTNEHET